MHIRQLNHSRCWRGFRGEVGRLLHITALIFAVTGLLAINFYPSLSLANQQPQSLLQQEAQEPATKLLVLGDSLSAAYGMPLEQGWVALLADAYPSLQVINASISGETTSGGLQRLPELMQQHQPQILLVELGANDALRGQNLLQSKNNLKAMLDVCQQSHQRCEPILLGIRLPTNYGPAYDALLQQTYSSLAQQGALLFHPFFIEDAALDPDLMQWDGLHPNAAAQPVILETLRPLIESAIQRLQPPSSQLTPGND